MILDAIDIIVEYTPCWRLNCVMLRCHCRVPAVNVSLDHPAPPSNTCSMVLQASKETISGDVRKYLRRSFARCSGGFLCSYRTIIEVYKSSAPLSLCSSGTSHQNVPRTIQSYCQHENTLQRRIEYHTPPQTCPIPLSQMRISFSVAR